MSVLESDISPLRHRVAAWPVEKPIPQLLTIANGATLDPGIAMQVYKGCPWRGSAAKHTNPCEHVGLSNRQYQLICGASCHPTEYFTTLALFSVLEIAETFSYVERPANSAVVAHPDTI